MSELASLEESSGVTSTDLCETSDPVTHPVTSVKVIIPTRKSATEVYQLVNQITATAGVPCEVFVTNIPDGSAAANRNKGLEWAGNVPYVCMIDDDCEVPNQGWLKVLVDAIERLDVVFTSATLYKPSGLPAYMTGLDDCQGSVCASGEWECPKKQILSACCVFKPNKLRFDENYVGSGFEDTDYCNQLSEEVPAGKFIICFESVVIHRNEMKEQRNNWQWNKQVYLAKWYGPMKPLVALYKTYRGGEWFEVSLESIYKQVTGIVVVSSQEPWSTGVDKLPENCLAALHRFCLRHPTLPIHIVNVEGNQGEQYRKGLEVVKDKFGLKCGVLIIDTDEVWENDSLRSLCAVMTIDKGAVYFRSKIHNYIKKLSLRIAPPEPHRPVVGLRDASAPYIKGRFTGAPSPFYRTINSHYHHFPLIRLEEVEIFHKLRNTASQDGPCHSDWIERVWNKLPAGKDIHPAKSYESCWQGVEEIDVQTLPNVVLESPTYCKMLLTNNEPIKVLSKFGIEFLDLPRFHRRFDREGDVIGLYNLLKMVDPVTMVEVGCGTGESTEIACQVAHRVWAVDRWQPDPLEPSSLFHENEFVFDLRTSRFTNLTKIKDLSIRAVTEFADNELDLVYLDAGHTKEAIRSDILAWLPKVRRGGWLAGHDYIWHQEVKEAVDELLGAVQVFEDTSWLYHVPANTKS